MVPVFGLFEMPYLVHDRDHMKRIRDEIVTPTMVPEAEKTGYRIIGALQAGYGETIIINVAGYAIDEFDPDDYDPASDDELVMKPDHYIGQLSELLSFYPDIHNVRNGSSPQKAYTLYDAAMLSFLTGQWSKLHVALGEKDATAPAAAAELMAGIADAQAKLMTLIPPGGVSHPAAADAGAASAGLSLFKTRR